ncbi:HK97 family phage prohead protease [Shinella zoogloeoides]|uniref:HK97 family phage prohead protease n=1 Tax=Shinella zoogloeoides TaxID=352475 RepID=UPI001F560BB4|nr:HK97 family phage prohead protease [Shinella zoogloeoides]
MHKLSEMDFEVRFGDVGDAGEIEGTAVTFNVVDSYRTEFAPDAFRGIEGRTVPMLWSHDPANVIGSWSSFHVRADGLTAKGKLNLAVAKALEVRSLLQAGDVKGLSIGFATVKDERRANGVRRILEASLKEISIVAFPAVPGSGITKVRTSTHGTETAAAAFAAACRAAATSLKGK